jgi:hypothetical protein
VFTEDTPLLTTLLTATTALFVIAVVALFAGLGAFWTALRFRSALIRIRLTDDLDAVAPADVASSRPAVHDLREAASLLIAAEGGFQNGLRRAKWELVGLGDAEARRADLASASGDLLQAQRAIRQANLKMPGMALDAGRDVPVFHDPVQALAARGHWVGWAALSVLPNVFAAAYGYRGTRAELLRLTAMSRALLAQVEAYRESAEPAPVRVALRDRLPLAA